MVEGIDYGRLMHHAMRGLIRQVLDDVARDGLPGSHHFFITFDTNDPDADLADWLKERYPEEMTVVIQNWFENLEVDDEGFAVTLNFGDQPERMYIPYSAIHTFVDPSVEFGLRFESTESEEAEAEDPAPEPAAPVRDPAKSEAAKGDAAPGEPGGEVVQLDTFRK